MVRPLDTRGLRVLVVDDDRAVRTTLKRGLATRGYLVVEADSGRAAVQLTVHPGPDGPPDVVLTDLLMPDGDGVEVIRELRKLGPAIIAMSGGGSLVDQDLLPSARLLGAHRTLAKPFGLDELDAAIKDVIAERAARNDAS